MNFSDKGIALLKQLEGFRAKPYADSGGKMTVGYGHLMVPGDGVAINDIIEEVQATGLLQRDVLQAVSGVNTYVKVDLDQNEFDALVIFVFNVGCEAFKRSTLLMMLNAGDKRAAALQFLRWDMAGGNHVPGLMKRRLAEETLFVTGSYEGT